MIQTTKDAEARVVKLQAEMDFLNADCQVKLLESASELRLRVRCGYDEANAKEPG